MAREPGVAGRQLIRPCYMQIEEAAKVLCKQDRLFVAWAALTALFNWERRIEV